MFDRVKCPPWGVAGGKEGKPGRITVLKKSGEEEVIFKRKSYPLEAGDAIIVETGGGGGYGPPAARSHALLERDVIRGYVSVEEAEKAYGVKLDPRSLSGSPF